MAFPTAPGLFVATFVDALDTTQLAIDLDVETHRGALWTNTGTYDLTADTAYGVAPWNANEVSGTGYTAGGNLLTTTVFVHTSGGVLKFDCDDLSWTTSTITARGLMSYADALAGNNALFAETFGGDFTTSAGTFAVQFAAGGVWTWDVIP